MDINEPIFELTDGQRRWLVVQAEKAGVPPVDYLRQRVPSLDLEQNLGNSSENNKRSALEVAKDHGLIGAISDGPADLATNPKHMQGFGSDGH